MNLPMHTIIKFSNYNYLTRVKSFVIKIVFPVFNRMRIWYTYTPGCKGQPFNNPFHPSSALPGVKFSFEKTRFPQLS